MKNHCVDCGKELSRRVTVRCKKCHFIWQKKHPELQSNFKGGISKRKCIDCGNPLKNRTSTTLRCFECHKKRIHKEYNCIDCGKKLSSGQAKRCLKCRDIYHSKNDRGYKLSLEQIEKMRKATILRWKDEDYKNRVVKKIMKANNQFPNKMEVRLQELLPTDYKYVGNGSVILDGLNPDFINTNGQKKIIEFYGSYWHERESYKERDKRRLRVYKKYGYKTLIIWDYEFKDIKKLKEKILVFHKI